MAEAIAILAAADGSIGQIPQNHFFGLERLRLQGARKESEAERWRPRKSDP